MTDKPSSEDRTDREIYSETVSDFRKDIVTMYVKQMEKCIEKQQDNCDVISEQCDRLDSDETNSKDSNDGCTTLTTTSPSPQNEPNVEESSLSVKCVKNNATGNADNSRHEGHVSPVRVSTTSFSVSDILDPKKFTGCNGGSKRINSSHIEPWLARKRRHTDDLESDDETLERHGQYHRDWQMYTIYTRTVC